MRGAANCAAARADRPQLVGACPAIVGAAAERECELYSYGLEPVAEEDEGCHGPGEACNSGSISPRAVQQRPKIATSSSGSILGVGHRSLLRVLSGSSTNSTETRANGARLSTATTSQATSAQLASAHPPDSVGHSRTYYTLATEDCLRAVWSHKPLRCLGRLLRNTTGGDLAQGFSEDHYHMSTRVEVIDEFWTHSWHADPNHKVATLLFHCNGCPSGILATAASFSTGAVVALLDRKQSLGYNLAGASSLIAGCCVFFFVLAFWQDYRMVFVDRICVSQTDEAKKAACLKSFAGILWNSSKLLVLWDASCLERLWCTLELAAFTKSLHLRGLPMSAIIVRPITHGWITLWGLCGVAVLTAAQRLFVIKGSNLAAGREQPGLQVLPEFIGFFLGCLIAFLACSPVILGYIQEVIEVERQVSQFTFAEAKCWCCSVGHISPELGTVVPCDRPNIAESIVHWFNSEQCFDNFVQGELLQHFRIHAGLPYCWALIVGLPWTWELAGRCAYIARAGALEKLPYEVARMFEGTFVLCPILIYVTFAVFTRLHKFPCPEFIRPYMIRT